ncbi:MAG: ABC-F family ATP-binding cassette domain-containing protein [Candidatus Abawacabacteria bacterium]|nr:ABC-F family ATP-binding cassette domain-containing protein [Candidatus Abawacabacteria bacterium]
MLNLQNISLYNGSILLLDNVNLSIDGSSGKKIAIVGKNGSGKSSLLKLLTGEFVPDQGRVTKANEIIGYLPQEITFPSNYQLVGEYLESFLTESWLQYQIDIALQKLDLPDNFLLKDLALLSGGEKVKVALAALLLQSPTVLLFDEPSNNLDLAGTIWLESFIKNFTGTVIFISHDRTLINRVSGYIWELDHEEHSLYVHTGSYEDFIAQRIRRREHQLQQHEAQYKEIVLLEKWLKANEFHPKYRYSDLVLSQKQALENLRKNLVTKPQPDPQISPQLARKTDKGLVMKAIITGKTFPEKQILQNLTFSIHHQEKVLITGPNGAGKTTLLNIIAGEDKNFAGTIVMKDTIKIGYLRQFSRLPTDIPLLEIFLQHTYTTESEARAILAKYLFPSEYMSSKLGSLSFGEIRRLELAIIITNKPHLLLLDEPTNHLDTFSREAIEKFIVENTIAMLVVSHDRYFIEKVGIERIINLQ